MYEQGWSWVRALETGTLTVHQRESLEALVDDGQADSLQEAAEMMDRDFENRVDREA